MAKKPNAKATPKVPKASRETKDAIDFFNDDLSAGDYIQKLSGKKDKKLVLSPAAGKPSRPPIGHTIAKKLEGSGEIISLAIITALFTAVAYWVITQ